MNGPQLRRLGQGARPLLAVHCSLAHAGAWSGLAERLGDRVTLTAFDLPGHGRSPELPAGTDFGDLATAWAGQVAADLPQPLDVIGHSFGAVVALRLALERPGLVRSLTLIEPTLFAVAAHTPEAAEFAAGSTGFEAAIDAGDFDRAARLFTADWGAGQPWESLPELQRHYIAARMPLIRAGEPTLIEDRAGLVAGDRLERLHLPVLLIGGSASPPISGAVLAALAARLPDARRVEVAGAAHMVPITHPGPVAEALAGFLSL